MITMPLNYTIVAVFAAALFAIYIIMWIFIKPIKYLLKAGINGVLGILALYGCNMLTGAMGFAIGVNTYTALTCAFLGIPGFLLILATKMMIR